MIVQFIKDFFFQYVFLHISFSVEELWPESTVSTAKLVFAAQCMLDLREIFVLHYLHLY